MRDINRCIKYIQKVKESYSNYDDGYASRFRLKRLIHNISELLESVNFDTNELSSLEKERDILEDMSSSICQASEPLNNRWKREWNTVEKKLDRIKKLIQKNKEA